MPLPLQGIRVNEFRSAFRYGWSLAVRTATPFGEYLDALLVSRGMSRRTFARLLRVNVGSVSGGRRKPMSEARMERWANALKLAGDTRQQFLDLASLAHAPQHLQRRFAALQVENAQLRAEVAEFKARLETSPS